MMTWDGVAPAIEAKARELDMWGPDDDNLPAHLRFWIDDRDGKAFVAMTNPRAREAEWVEEVDLRTVAGLLLAHESGQILTVGPCRACAERRGGWEWAALYLTRYALRYEQEGWAVVRHEQFHMWTAVCPCPECSEPGPPVECDRCVVAFGGVTLFHHDGREERLEPGARVWFVDHPHEGEIRPEHVQTSPCPKCEGAGKAPGPPEPTGLDRRPLAQALLDARTDDAVRDVLLVWADKRQAAGDPLGLLVALTLSTDDKGRSMLNPEHVVVRERLTLDALA